MGGWVLKIYWTLPSLLNYIILSQDGYVDFVEFMAIFYIMSEKPPEEIMTKIFQMFDINQDGIITQE